MTVEFASFAFIVTLAAVVNGLGIVRWLNELANYLAIKKTAIVDHYWVYTLTAVFQFMLHVVLWWSLWSLRTESTLNFLTYLYMLAGPVLLFVGSAFLAPGFEGEHVKLRKHYFAARPTYTTVLVLIWAWTILAAPVFRGYFVPHTGLFVVFLLIAIAQRSSDNEALHRFAAVLNWLLLIIFVLFYGLELGGLTPTFDVFD